MAGGMCCRLSGGGRVYVEKVSDRAAVTHVVEVCGQVVADLLELREAVGSLLLCFLFEVTLRGQRALDALIHRPLALYQLRVHLLPRRPLLLLQRNTQCLICI